VVVYIKYKITGTSKHAMACVLLVFRILGRRPIALAVIKIIIPFKPDNNGVSMQISIITLSTMFLYDTFAINCAKCLLINIAKIAAIPPAISAVQRKTILCCILTCSTNDCTATRAPFLALSRAYKVTKERTKLLVEIPPIRIINPLSPSLGVNCILITAAVAAPIPGA
jgi:hypothetical protein